MILPIKKKWFDMIATGVKKEEYREISKYYTIRFENVFKDKETAEIKLRNGYSRMSRTLICRCSIKTGIGKEEWGAVKNKKYYILTIHNIIKQNF